MKTSKNFPESGNLSAIVSRRLLSPLESIERDAIVQTLLDHPGQLTGVRGTPEEELRFPARFRTAQS